MMRHTLRACRATGAAAALFVPPAAGAELDFAHEILPILRERCAECHTNGKYKGRFSMDTRDAILESGNAVPGSPEKSELIYRITTDDEDDRMPPEGDPLSTDDIAAIRAWIEEDLPWEDGFTFREKEWDAPLAHRRPDVPSADEFAFDHPLDRFAAQYFADREIEFPPPADDAAFLRRVFLDLIGLPPRRADIEAFAADRSTDKRSRVVRELLARDVDYADHWLTFWNDLLRNDYTGTGFIDGGRKQITAWLYAALRENKPYDAMARELIAASPDTEGFINGIKWRGNVNASQRREVQFAQNVSQIFLGENMKCASCHDSFIDDWKLADAYALAAVVADEPLELHRCDKPTGEFAKAAFPFPEVGEIDPEAPKDARLARTADLLTDPANGRFARTIVNRFWQRVMGRGLVEPVDIMSSRPWSEDILDWLAAEFADNGYDIRKLLELIATSRIYQAASADPHDGAPADYVFRGPLPKRLTAEQFLDAVWTVTGAGNAEPAADVARGGAEPSGPAVRASLAAATPLMLSLGRPTRDQVVTTRPDELSTLQALVLSNGAEFAALVEQGADTLAAENLAPAELVGEVFLRALTRAPTRDERIAAAQLLGSNPDRAAIADLLWSVFMLPEFQIVR